MAYNQFAEVYDGLMKDAPYNEWVTLTEKILKDRNFPQSASVLDLGCGTGEITVRLSHQGYNMTGVDYSSDMLAIAQDKALEARESIAWIHQDMRELEGFEGIDVCISYCDVMNYVTKEDDVLNTCKRVASSLQKNGIFIFDVHDMNYAKTSLAGHTFAEANEDIAYIWECHEGDREGQLFHDISFFQKKKENTYEKFMELHEQQVYTLAFYEDILKKAGFSKVIFFNDFHLEKAISSKNRMRNFIIAEK